MQQKAPEQLAKFSSYVLGRHPDEFGLIPDQDGYIKIKELLKAVCEEEGWRHIRRSHLDEILLTLPKPPFEIKENLIRATDRKHLNPLTPVSEKLPGLLYTCVRKKAHPVVLEKGIRPAGHSHVILSSDRKMAERIGKRSDHSPIILTVHVQKSVNQGISFLRAGETLFLTEYVPIDCFTAPPLPKEKPQNNKPDVPQEPMKPHIPGSFFMDFDREEEQKKFIKEKRKNKITREKDRKKARKQKRKWQGF